MSTSRQGFPLRVMVWAAMATAATIIAYFVITGALAAASLVDAKKHAEQVVDTYNTPAPDLERIINEVGLLRADLIVADQLTSGPLWWSAAKAPIVGESVEAARRIVGSAGELARASERFEAVARAFLAAGGPGIGRPLPDSVLTQLTPAIQRLASAADTASDQLSGINPAALPGPAATAMEKIKQKATEALPQLRQLSGSAQVLAMLLGANGPRRWFVAMQNGAESRGTGGLVGSFAVLAANKGTLTVERVGSNDELTATADVSGIPESSQQLWGSERLAKIYGVNLSPHFPYAGQLLTSLWNRQSGSQVDAAIGLGQPATVALIEAVGGVTVDAVSLTGANAYEFLTVGVYEKYPDPKQKDGFIAKLIGTLFQRLTSGSVAPMKLLTEFMVAANNRELLVWSAEPAAQEQLAATPIGGVVSEAAGPFALAVVNNNAGNKMDAFLHTSVTYQQGECVVGGRRGTVRVELFNDPPAELPAYVDQRYDRSALWDGSKLGDGSNRVRLAVYLPRGAYVDGSSTPSLFSGAEREHPVQMFGVELGLRERKTITVNFTELASETDLNTTPVLLSQPMLNPQVLKVESGANC